MNALEVPFAYCSHLYGCFCFDGVDPEDQEWYIDDCAKRERAELLRSELSLASGRLIDNAERIEGR